MDLVKQVRNDVKHSRRERLIRVALMIGVPLLLLCGAELLLRIAGFGYSPHFWIPVEGKALLTTNDAFAQRFIPYALGRTPVPELLQPTKDRHTRRIFVLGESAAMGFPEPAFGVARMLEVILNHRNPDLKWEVFNAAMTAINSHAILPVARECARLDPDAFVVLMGNNEAVGPYGPGTVFGRAGLSLPLVRLSVWQTSTRLGQAALEVIRKRGSSQSEWRGMEMFVNQRLPQADPRLAAMYRNFEANLRDIIQAGVHARASVVVVTVPVNLLDCPPFASSHRTGMTGEEIKSWTAAFEKGKDAEAKGTASAATQYYRLSLSIDPGYAEAHYRLARCLMALGESTAAVEHYRHARDLDTLRFRADTAINNIIRKVAKEQAADRVRLVDADAQPGSGGEDMFYEHVHLTPEGNYRLATMLANRLIGEAAVDTEMPDVATVRRTLALTRWDESRMRAQIAALMERLPFSQQIDHEKRLTRFKSTIERGALQSGAIPSYEIAIRARPDDIHLRGRYAELLREAGKPSDSAEQWATLVALAPGRKIWQASLAAALSDAGRQNEAIAAYNRALAIDPRFDLPHFGLGVARARERNYSEAEQHYRRALKLNPAYAEAEYNLAGVLGAQGRTEDAQAALERSLALRPSFSEARIALAQILARSSNPESAVDEYRKALQNKPELPEAHYDLAVLLAQKGRLMEAIQHYEQAIELRRDYPEAYNNLGTALARQGDYAGAARAFARALEIKPSFDAAQANLQRIRGLNASRR